MSLGLLLLAGSAQALPLNIQAPNLLESADLKKELRFSLQTGQTESLATVIVFLSSKCPCSAAHESAIKNLALEFQPKGFQFVGIHSNADEQLEQAREHFKASLLPFPILQDSGAVLADQFGALKTPHVFVVKGGEVVFQGGVDDSKLAQKVEKSFLKDALLALSEGREPPLKQARALGCVIRRP